MSALARLARVNRAREDRAKRARLQASRELANTENSLSDALARREGAEARRLAAEFLLAHDPADAQALIWRRVATDALSDAKERESEARDRHALAQRALDTARREHDRRALQGNAIDSRLAQERLLIRNRRDELAADEFASGRETANNDVWARGSA